MYEQLAIDALDPEYNSRSRADSNLGMKHSNKTRAKMSAAHIGRAAPTAETLAKISAAHKGKVISPEHRAKISAARKGVPSGIGLRNKGNTIWLGRKHTPESKAKMAAVRLGTIMPPETRAKISNALKGNTFNAGKTASVETRARMSAAHMGNKNAAGRWGRQE